MEIKTKRLLLVTAFSFIWAALVIVDKYALNIGIDPLPFAYQRLLVASAISILPILALYANKTSKKRSSIRSIKSLKKQDILRLSSVGMIGGGLGAIAMFYGLKYSTTTNYGFLIKTTVIFSILLAYIFLKEDLTKKKAICTVALLLGAYLISTGGKTLIPHFGDTIILLAALFYSGANVIAKPLLKLHSPEMNTAFRSFFGALIILVFSLFTIPSFYIIQDAKLVIITGILAFLTIYILNKLLEISSISYTTSMSMLFSIFTATMGHFAFGETMNTIQIAGAFLILASVLMIHNSKI